MGKKKKSLKKKPDLKRMPHNINQGVDMGSLLYLQQTIGNQAFGRILDQVNIQEKSDPVIQREEQKDSYIKKHKTYFFIGSSFVVLAVILGLIWVLNFLNFAGFVRCIKNP